MALIRSRDDLKEYCLRRLGYPVIEINVDDNQLEDRIDDALQFFAEFHYDGTDKVYLKYIVKQEDIDNGYITISSSNNFQGEESQNPTESGVTNPVKIEDTIVSVLEIFNLGGVTMSMFDIRYQYVLHDLYTIGSIDLQHYSVTMEYLSLLRQLLSPDKSIRFNRKGNRLYIDGFSSNDIQPGDYIIINATRIADPTVFPKIYDDYLLKKYATALIKRQWGQNLSKYNGVQMLGGITFNGQQIYNEANEEINKIEDKIREEWMEPPDFFVA